MVLDGFNCLPVLIISDSTLFEVNQNNSNTLKICSVLTSFFANLIFSKPCKCKLISYCSDCSEVSWSSYCTLETTMCLENRGVTFGLSEGRLKLIEQIKAMHIHRQYFYSSSSNIWLCLVKLQISYRYIFQVYPPLQWNPFAEIISVFVFASCPTSNFRIFISCIFLSIFTVFKSSKNTFCTFSPSA